MSLIKRVFLMEYVWQRKWSNEDNSLLGEKCVAKALLLICGKVMERMKAEHVCS